MGSNTRWDGLEIREAELLLRPWRPSDADQVYRACQDPEIQRWTNVPRPYTREHAEAFVTTTAEKWEAHTSAPIGVFDASTGEMLGSSGLVHLDLARRTGEIGYWTAAWARARGVATRSTRAVARWAFDTLDLHRLVWQAEVGNQASGLVAARVGVRFEGVLRQALIRPDGSRADGWIGSLLPGDLLESDASVDPVIALRAAAFGAPPPRISAVTPDGATVTLRAPDHRDLDAIVSACRDPESVRWTTVPDPYDRADAASFINEHAPGRWARGEGGVFAVADPDDGYAGSMELRLTATDTGDVGYLIAPWARGHGYAPTALRALCAWGFERLGLNRIEWRAFVGNDASRRVAEKAGFQMEGVVRDGCVQRGEYRDAWTAAVLATDPRTHGWPNAARTHGWPHAAS